MKEELISSSLTKSGLLSNIGKSFVAGLGGYALFLGILFLTKTISTIIQPEESMQFETTDFVLPIIGFFLLFLIKLLENLKTD